MEKPQKDFPGLELEPVELKPGQVSRYQPVTEKLPTVQLREIPDKAPKEGEQLPDWASGDVKLGEPVGKWVLIGKCKINLRGNFRFTQLEEPEPEPNIPHRDQVKLKGAKPKPAAEGALIEHVTIEESKAKIVQPQQGPPVEPEKIVRGWRGNRQNIMGFPISI